MAPRRKFEIKFKEKVLQYAEETSGEEAAKRFDIDPRRIRYWKKQKTELLSADKKRARLTGGGRKKVSMELEGKLSEWIYQMRDKHNRVYRKMIQKKALEIYSSVSDADVCREQGLASTFFTAQRALTLTTHHNGTDRP